MNKQRFHKKNDKIEKELLNKECVRQFLVLILTMSGFNTNARGPVHLQGVFLLDSFEVETPTLTVGLWKWKHLASCSPTLGRWRLSSRRSRLQQGLEQGPLSSALGRQRQAELCEFQAGLLKARPSYTVCFKTIGLVT